MLQESAQKRPNIYQILRQACQMQGREVPIKDVWTFILLQHLQANSARFMPTGRHRKRADIKSSPRPQQKHRNSGPCSLRQSRRLMSLFRRLLQCVAGDQLDRKLRSKTRHAQAHRLFVEHLQTRLLHWMVGRPTTSSRIDSHHLTNSIFCMRREANSSLSQRLRIRRKMMLLPRS